MKEFIVISSTSDFREEVMMVRVTADNEAEAVKKVIDSLMKDDDLLTEAIARDMYSFESWELDKIARVP